jgi:hypothetical protein
VRKLIKLSLKFALAAFCSLIVFNLIYLKINFWSCPIPEDEYLRTINEKLEDNMLPKKQRFILIYPREFDVKNEIERIAIASQKLGWSCYYFSYAWKASLFKLDASLLNQFTNFLNRLFHFDFAVTLRPSPLTIRLKNGVPNYLYLPENLSNSLSRISANWNHSIPELVKMYPSFNSSELNNMFIGDYSGYLHSTNDLKWLDKFKLKDYSMNYKKFNPNKKRIKWYLSSFNANFLKLNYKQIALPAISKKLAENNVKYKRLIEGLKADDVLYQNTGYSFTSQLKELREAGIALVLSRGSSPKDKTPNSDIFQAAAASNVIIAERTPFIEQEFGECVLYIDSRLPADAIYYQTKAYIKCI